MNRFWRLPAVLVFLSACSGKSDWPLPEKELIPLLVDVHLAESAASHLTGPVKDSVIQVYYNQIFTIHEMDSASFERVMAALDADPALMIEVYKQMEDEIARRENRSVK